VRGRVVQINPHRAMVGIQTEEGDYSIVELLGDSVELEVGVAAATVRKITLRTAGYSLQS
jgi:hypothetical protein